MTATPPTKNATIPAKITKSDIPSPASSIGNLQRRLADLRASRDRLHRMKSRGLLRIDFHAELFQFFNLLLSRVTQGALVEIQPPVRSESLLAFRVGFGDRD